MFGNVEMEGGGRYFERGGESTGVQEVRGKVFHKFPISRDVPVGHLQVRDVSATLATGVAQEVPQAGHLGSVK